MNRSYKLCSYLILFINAACSHNPTSSVSTASTNSSAWDTASSVLSIVAPLALGAGAGVLANKAVAGDSVNYAALAHSQAASSIATNMLANNLIEMVDGSPKNATNIPIAASSIDRSSSMHGDINGLDFSGNCDEVQAKGTRYVQEIGRSAIANGPSICESSKAARLLGQIAVKVAEACKNIPEWTQMRDAGLQQIRQAETAISKSCHS